jgi:hypothetical protein
MSSVGSKQAVVFVIFGTIIGLLIGMSLPSVTADHEAEISTLNSRLSALNITLKSIDDKFLANNPGSVFDEIVEELDDLGDAIEAHN